MKHPNFKKLFLTVTSVFILLSLSAQSDTAKSRKNSIAFNVNGLLAQLLNNNSGSQTVITYRRHFQKWNLRVGLGGHYNLTEFDGSNPSYFDNSSAGAHMNIGYERTVLTFKHWQGYAGIDVVGGFYQYSTTSPYDNGVIRERSGYTWSGGVSPLLGINYQLNPLIGLGIETSYRITYNSGLMKDKYLYNGGVYSTYQERYYGISTSSGSPLRITLRICF